MALRDVMTVAALTLMTLGAVQSARADDCLGSSLSTVVAEDAAMRVDVRAAGDRWEARARPVHVEGGTWARLARVPKHAHLIAAVPAEGARFAVVRSGGGVDHDARVLVYEATEAAGGERGPGAAILLVRAYALADLLTPEELRALRPSVSHLQWLDTPRGADGPVRVTGGARVELAVIGGRVVTLDLAATKPPAPGAP